MKPVIQDHCRCQQNCGLSKENKAVPGMQSSITGGLCESDRSDFLWSHSYCWSFSRGFTPRMVSYLQISAWEWRIYLHAKFPSQTFGTGPLLALYQMPARCLLGHNWAIWKTGSTTSCFICTDLLFSFLLPDFSDPVMLDCVIAIHHPLFFYVRDQARSLALNQNRFSTTWTYEISHTGVWGMSELWQNRSGMTDVSGAGPSRNRLWPIASSHLWNITSQLT